MLKILLLWFLIWFMGRLLHNKGRKPLFMQAMIVAVWLLGSVPYIVFIMITEGQEALKQMDLVDHPWVLLSEALGQGCLFLIAWLLPKKLEAASIDETPEVFS